MSSQGLPTEGPTPRSSFTPSRKKQHTAELTVDGVVPTTEEFVTAMKEVFAPEAGEGEEPPPPVAQPGAGDLIAFTVDDVVKFRGEFVIESLGGGPFEIELVLGEGDAAMTFYVLLTQTGLY